MTTTEEPAPAERSEPIAADMAPSARRWAQTLRVHLSVIIVMLLVGISVPLMLLTYRQGSNEAIAAAEKQMKLLSQHTLDRYRSLFDDGNSVATIAPAVLLLTAEPPANAEAKADFMIRVLRGSPNIDGVYVGYPSGSFVQALNVRENAEWRQSILAPQETAFAMRTIMRSSLDAVADWRFLDIDGKLVG
jgi:adenylate cyclase